MRVDLRGTKPESVEEYARNQSSITSATEALTKCRAHMNQGDPVKPDGVKRSIMTTGECLAYTREGLGLPALQPDQLSLFMEAAS